MLLYTCCKLDNAPGYHVTKYVAKITIAGKIHGITTSDLEMFERVVRTWQKALPMRPVHLFKIEENEDGKEQGTPDGNGGRNP